MYWPQPVTAAPWPCDLRPLTIVLSPSNLPPKVTTRRPIPLRNPRWRDDLTNFLLLLLGARQLYLILGVYIRFLGCVFNLNMVIIIMINVHHSLTMHNTLAALSCNVQVLGCMGHT